MKQETIELIGKITSGVANIFKSISPYSQSIQISEDFKLFLSKLDELNRTEIGDVELNKLIRDGYVLANSFPKCLPPTEACKNEHQSWGYRVQDYMFMLVNKFKEKGYDVGAGSELVPAPIKFDEKNLLKIGLVAVVVLIIISLLRK